MSAKMLPQAPLSEVLYERLEYLIDYHDGEHADCDECRRMSAIRTILLIPFEERLGAQGAVSDPWTSHSLA